MDRKLEPTELLTSIVLNTKPLYRNIDDVKMALMITIDDVFIR